MTITNSAPEHFLPKSDVNGNLVQSRFSDGDLDGGTNSHINNTEGSIRIGDSNAQGNGTVITLNDVEKRAGIGVNSLGANKAQLLMETAGVFLSVEDATRFVQLALSALGTVELGTNNGNGTKLSMNDEVRQIILQCLTVEPESDGVTDLGTALKSFKKLFLDSTITDEITGNRTINKACGTVWFAAGASTLNVSCNLVTINSLVFAVVRTDDPAASVKNVTVGSGSFIIRLLAPATNDTEVAFWVLN